MIQPSFHSFADIAASNRKIKAEDGKDEWDKNIFFIVFSKPFVDFKARAKQKAKPFTSH